MAWDTETEKYEIQEKWHEKVFRLRGTRAPEFLDKEPIDHYRKRLMTKAAPFVAADLQEVKTDHLYGSALDHYEQRYFESAAAEATRPTNIPEGTLKQVTKYDALQADHFMNSMDRLGRGWIILRHLKGSWLVLWIIVTFRKFNNEELSSAALPAGTKVRHLFVVVSHSGKW